jgi:hypothetical protein
MVIYSTKLIENSVPVLIADRTSIFALWACKIFNEEANPKPIPFLFVVK